MNDDQGQESVLRIGNVAGSLGIVNLNANGRLITRRIDRIDGYGIFNFNGGYLEMRYTDHTYFKDVDEVNLLPGGAVIDTTDRLTTILPPLQGPGGLTKLGTGSLSLGGTNTYSGSTVVSNGSFAVGLPMSSSSLTLGSNASLSLTVGAEPNSSWSPTSITLEGSNSLTFSYGPSSQPSATLLNTTTLSATGTNVVNIVGTGWPVGTTRLIDYTGSVIGGGTFVLGPLPIGLNARLTNNTSTTSIDLVVSTGVNTRDWYGHAVVGGTGGGIWDIATSFNWDSGTAFYNEYGPVTNRLGDSVLFTVSGNLSVELTTTVRPSSVLVTNTAVGSPYNFTGSGKISGPTSLIKDSADNSSYMILGTVNDYTGGTYIRVGGLWLGAENALPTSGIVYVGTPGKAANLTLNGFNQTVGGIVSTGSGAGQRRVLNAHPTHVTLTINVPANQTYSYTHQTGNTTAGGTAEENNFSVVKTGDGIQALGNCGYSGTTTIAAGTLLFNGAAAINATNTVTVHSGATIGGHSTGNNCLGGPVTVLSGARLEPGNPLDPIDVVGILTVSNTVTLQGQTIMELNRTNARNCDRLVGNLVNLGGTLLVTNVGDPLQLGDTFNLFDRVLSGNFSSVSLPPLTAGLVWNTNNLAIDGTINVVAPPPLTFGSAVVSGGQILLSGVNGPANGTYYVLSSPSAATPLALWVPVLTNQFNETGGFSVSIPVGSDPQKYYRLQVP